MKINHYRSELEGDGLATVIMDTTTAITQRLQCALPNGWRQIVKLTTLSETNANVDEDADEDSKGTPPQELFYLDVEADEGGGSWAEAKLNTLQNCKEPATLPLPMNKIFTAICKAKMNHTPIGKEICDLKDPKFITDRQWDWLVDTENGPGFAPDYGGIRVTFRCHYFKDGEIMTETDVLYVAFSGAAAWQDLQFMLTILAAIYDHFQDKKDESFEWDFSEFEKYPDIWYWMINLGIVPAPQK